MIFRIFLVFHLCHIAAFQLAAQEYDQAIAKARFLIQEHQKQTNIPGLQVALMIEGEMIWNEAMGYADLENSIPATVNTKFRTASIAKPLTAIALGKMIEDNLISLDQTIGEFFADYPSHLQKITVRQLAGCIAGIRHYNENDPKFRTEDYESALEASNIFKNDSLVFEPGSDYGYSSYGYVLLSALMSEASGSSFEKIMSNSWEKLGADHTVFDFPDKEISQKSKFFVKSRGSNRELAPFENRSYMYAGGGYLSTAGDLVRIGHHFMNYQYISKSVVDTLTTTLYLNNGVPTYYGLGWEIGSSKIDTKVWYHNGSMPTARTHWILMPEEDIVLAYMSNTGEHVFFNDSEAHAIAKIFLDAKRAKSRDISYLQDLSGVWKGKVTSLYGKSRKAKLELKANQDQSVSGVITFTRSRKKESYPVIVNSIAQDSVHLIAVTPMFADFHLEMDSNDNLIGEWQHEFVRKPNQIEDNFWKRRNISLRKIQD